MILAVCSQKGGVGKTSTVQNLAAGLRIFGYSVLTIDMDPQCNLTFSSGVDPTGEQLTVGDVLRGSDPAQAIIAAEEYSIIPGDYGLTSADKDLTGADLLRTALKGLKRRFDFMVIDCPPTLGILTINALTAADEVLIPLTAGIFSLQGFAQLINAITNVKLYTNKKLKVNGLLVTRYRKASISAETKEAIQAVAAQVKAPVYKAAIREGIAVSDSQSARGSLFLRKPKANVTADYNQFVSEFLSNYQRG